MQNFNTDNCNSFNLIKILKAFILHSEQMHPLCKLAIIICLYASNKGLKKYLGNFQTTTCLISLLTSRRPQFGFIVQSESIYHAIDNRIVFSSLNCKRPKEIKENCT